MDRTELKAVLEAIIYIAEEPVSLDQIAIVLEGTSKEELRAALAELVETSRTAERGLEVREVASGYKISTKAEHHEIIRRFVKSLKPPLKLSLPALETLAVIAYRQPATLPEIQEIRGVNAAGVIKTLLDRKLIVTAGRKPCIGRPILYRTSREFLIRFGLKDLEELPSLEEFEELARAELGEFSEPAPARTSESATTSSESPAPETPAAVAETEEETAEDAPREQP